MRHCEPEAICWLHSPWPGFVFGGWSGLSKVVWSRGWVGAGQGAGAGETQSTRVLAPPSVPLSAEERPPRPPDFRPPARPHPPVHCVWSKKGHRDQGKQLRHPLCDSVNQRWRKWFSFPRIVCSFPPAAVTRSNKLSVARRHVSLFPCSSGGCKSKSCLPELNSRHRQCWLFLEALAKTLFPGLFQLLEATCIPWSVAPPPSSKHATLTSSPSPASLVWKPP